MGFLGFNLILLIVFISCFIGLIPAIFFILTMQKALEKCSPGNRTTTPGSAWLLLIPLFNLVWDFILVSHMADSLEREFKGRNIPVEPLPGKNVGMAWCILAVCSIIPILGILSGFAALVCWILYWVKIAGFSALLNAPPVPLAARFPA